jgi:hypothetical protein
MKRSLLLFSIFGVLCCQNARAAPQEVPVLEEKNVKARTQQAEQGSQMSYAPFVILGVLAVGGIIAALAASNSSSGS